MGFMPKLLVEEEEVYGGLIGNPVAASAATTLQAIIGATQTEGKAGMLTVTIDGDIEIRGKNSLASFQQSINGGGGDVNVFYDLTEAGLELSEDSTPNVPDNLGVMDHVDNMKTTVLNKLGAEKVQDAIGEVVNYVQSGNILAVGDSFKGSSVQSVGGGGGQSYIDLEQYEGQQVDTSLTLGATEAYQSEGGAINESRSGNTNVRETTASVLCAVDRRWRWFRDFSI